MKFPNAYAGVKKIFTAEILSLIASVCLTITLAFTYLGVVSAQENSTTGAVASVGGIALFGIAAAVIAVVAFIIKIIGINKASLDEPSFKIALYLVIAGIAVSVISGFFQNNSTVQTIFSAVSDIIDLAISIFIIQGIRNLSVALNNEEMDNRGSTLFKIIIIVYALVIIARIISLIFSSNAGRITAGVIAIIAGILDIIQYILFLKVGS